MRIFNAESPLMEGLSRVFDLMILNLIVLVCCLPVFTAGAALTAMHYVLIKMVRDEDGYLIRSYLRSFKENFVQATGMWLIFLVFMVAFVVDLGLVGDPQGAASRLPAFIRYALIAGGIYVYAIYLYAFPLLARFRNTVFGTLRNAATIAAAVLPRTIAMIAATLALPVLARLFPLMLPVMLLFGIAGPGFICALLYNPVFKKLEESYNGGTGEESVDPAQSDADTAAERMTETDFCEAEEGSNSTECGEEESQD